MAVYDPPQLATELTAAGLPVEGADATGRVQYARALTPAELTTAQAVIAAHDPLKRGRDETTARTQAQAAAADLKQYLDRAAVLAADPPYPVLRRCQRVLLSRFTDRRSDSGAGTRRLVAGDYRRPL